MQALQRLLDARIATLSRSVTPAKVHHARIVARRLRVLLRALQGSFERAAVKRYMRALQSLAHDLDAVREADVTRAALRQWTSGGGARQVNQAQPLYLAVVGERARAVRALRTIMTAPAWQKRQAQLRQLATLEPTRVLAPRLLRQLRRRARHALRETDRGHQQLHKLRLKIKMLRYFLEEFPPPGPSAVRTEVKYLRHLQDCLGELHDAWRLKRRLRTDLRRFAAARAVRATLRRQQRAHRSEFRHRRKELLRL
ncbi:MAG: CHAD domain-containing protein [Steroidobacterales bacterium]